MTSKSTYLMPTLSAPLLLPEDKQAAKRRVKVRQWAFWIAASFALAAGVVSWALSH